jgi:tetratricopeptide (TPR) repeat protein
MKTASSKVKKSAKTPAAAAPRPTIRDWLHRREPIAAAAIVAITALVYLRCLANGYVFDDHEMIIVNRYIGDWSFLWKALVNDSWWFRDPAHLPQSHYYRPLQDIWLGLNYQLFGLNPIGPHALMVGLHLVAVMVAYGIAARLAADWIAGLVAALFFGLLPVHAEAVIWATAIPESLAGTLQLGAFYLYLRSRDRDLKHALAWSLILFGGALLSHESAIAFPLVIAVHAFLFDDREDVLRQAVRTANRQPHPNPLSGQGEGKEKVAVPDTKVALPDRAEAKEKVALPVTLRKKGFRYSLGDSVEMQYPLPDTGEGRVWVTDESGPHLPRGVGAYWIRARTALVAAIPFVAIAFVYLMVRLAVLGFIAKRDVNNQATLAQIILTVPSVLAHNLADIVNPWQAGPSHRIFWVNSPLSPDFWMPAAGLTLIAVAGFMAIADSPKLRVYLFSAAWLLLAMAPVLNLGILYPNALVADRYLYFSSFGLCLMVGQAVAAVGRANLALARPVAAVVTLAAAVYALTLWQVQHFWHDEIALFGRCIERFPDSGFCHNRLGMALQTVGDVKGGERELALAFKLDPSDHAAEYDLAMVHAQQGLYSLAAQESADALKHLPNAPPSAYIALAQLYDAAGDADARNAALEQAEKLPGGALEVRLARARIKLEHKDGAGAEQELKPLLDTAPDDPRLLLLAGSAMAIQKRYEDALGAYEHALRGAPGNATLRFLIALTMHNLGRNREALSQCQLVLQAKPGDPNARALLQVIGRDLRAQSPNFPN